VGHTRPVLPADAPLLLEVLVPVYLLCYIVYSSYVYFLPLLAIEVLWAVCTLELTLPSIPYWQSAESVKHSVAGRAVAVTALMRAMHVIMQSKPMVSPLNPFLRHVS
jgi:hypothetical protein